VYSVANPLGKKPLQKQESKTGFAKIDKDTFQATYSLGEKVRFDR
jgi:hypothetical protein